MTTTRMLACPCRGKWKAEESETGEVSSSLEPVLVIYSLVGGSGANAKTGLPNGKS